MLRTILCALTLATFTLLTPPHVHADEVPAVSEWTFGPSLSVGRFTFGSNTYEVTEVGAGFYIGRRLTDQFNLNINLTGATRATEFDRFGLGTAIGVGWGPSPAWANLVSVSVGIDLARSVDGRATGVLTGDVGAENVYLLLNFGMNLGK